MIYQYSIKIDKSLSTNQMEKLMTIVSEKRRLKANRFIHQKDRERCLLAEALVRYALIKDYGMKEEKILFDRSRHGKPLLIGSNLHFNLSHSGKWVVCAIGNSQLGVDVELVRLLEYKNIYKSFSSTERMYLDALPSQNKQTSFFKLWTLKESFVKFTGIGLKYPFDSFSIDVNSLKLLKEEQQGTNLSFFSRKLDEKHWYALCCEPDKINKKIKQIDLDEILSFW
ncbi:4'-phosphopantetheinyl transferase family protein [Streptococcus mutans]|jgi:Phosphopantetheinyl transferase|uniref:4'-phosphopantetheinyl transferase family protein n=1 Tax=Streptococcus mutans TaxID=1309 RepID=UPI000F22A823|nr:4'-phosphopantetheinyl transferase superfamily protein [Streptococcus mutans]RKV63837.1 MAG: 4'-phosphopantetheinyl transferase superfamily protein [Streptococcus sp.]MCB4949354.1 4'-phosphopantetheinyl transferase superfamily protein [Streptococcus mutans]MCB4960591.1 4'-phosphopantetheinyl transferase superfamily protein [Streptococcus mutans]MCB5078289.1 4'-phosphopantetheinyl transferase superfamily protein [Streptococcus mutans]MCB5128232.1 4'-phosphopantetheinyl transferase superfamil